MRCFHPIVIKRDGIAQEVPCGKCPACRRNYQLQWIIRLQEEQKHSEAAYFVTLTYSDVHGPSFDKKRCQAFLNRIQHRCKYKGVTLKYFFVSEHCPSSGRPHHHAIFFLDRYLDNFSQFIADGWPFGFITVSDCNQKRINYVTGYCLKKQGNAVDWSSLPDELNPDKCRLISKGLGLKYLSDRVKAYHKDGLVHTYSLGNMYAELPRYYKDKLFDEDDKEVILSTNRCYDIKQRNKEFRRFGLEFYTYKGLDGKFRERLRFVNVEKQLPFHNLVEHMRINEKKKLLFWSSGTKKCCINEYFHKKCGRAA